MCEIIARSSNDFHLLCRNYMSRNFTQISRSRGSPESECQLEDELRPRRDQGGGVIRDPVELPATSQTPGPPVDGPLIRGEFLTDLRENKSV